MIFGAKLLSYFWVPHVDPSLHHPMSAGMEFRSGMVRLSRALAPLYIRFRGAIGSDSVGTAKVQRHEESERLIEM